MEVVKSDEMIVNMILLFIDRRFSLEFLFKLEEWKDYIEGIHSRKKNTLEQSTISLKRDRLYSFVQELHFIFWTQKMKADPSNPYNFYITEDNLPCLPRTKMKEVQPTSNVEFPIQAYQQRKRKTHSESGIVEQKVREASDGEDNGEMIIQAIGLDMKQLISKGPYTINDLQKYPYSAIGVVLSRQQKTKRTIYSTGCLIAPNVILTCAHNCWDVYRKDFYEEIEFVPSPIFKHTDSGFKVIQKYVPEQFINSDIYSPDQTNKGLLYDYALLKLDTEGYDLSSYFGTIGYDFYWQETNKHKDSMKQSKVIEALEIYGYSRWMNKCYLVQMRGSAYSDEHFLLHTMPTQRGASGSPLLGFNNEGFTIRGIHQRDISNIITSQDESVPKKAALKLSKDMFRDLFKHFKQQANIHTYDLAQKGISSQRLNEIIPEIMHNRLLLNPKNHVVSLKLRNNRIGNEGCLHLANSSWQNLHDLDLRSNFIGDQGCLHLAGAYWPLLMRLNLNSNQITAGGCKYLASASGWDCFRVLQLKSNDIGLKGYRQFSKLTWDIIW